MSDLKILLDLAVALALCGDCLADIAQLRAHPEVFGPVASDPTGSRLLAALAADAPQHWQQSTEPGPPPEPAPGPPPEHGHPITASTKTIP